MSGSVMRQDSDYLAWGVWIHVPNAVPGVDTTVRTNPATVAAFASGSDPFQVPAALTGTATYNGVASGLYAAGGMVEYFEADASLSADFGGRSGNDSTPATEGSDGFLSAPSTAASPTSRPAAWTSTARLRWEERRCSVPIARRATRFTGNTQGTLGGRALTGSWTGQFYGPNRAPAGSVAVRPNPHDGFRHLRRRNAFGRFFGPHPGLFGTWKAD